MRNIFIGLLCLIWGSFASAAQDYRFTLISRSDIDQEIVVARVLPFYQYLGGRVELHWSNSEMDQAAEQVITKMIKAGVRQADILPMKSADSRSIGLHRGQLSITLKTRKTLATCQAFSLRAQSPEVGQESCAINDNLDISRMKAP